MVTMVVSQAFDPIKIPWSPVQGTVYQKALGVAKIRYRADLGV